jgi:hypothetical protein
MQTARAPARGQRPSCPTASRAPKAPGRRLQVPHASLLNAIVKPITTSGQVRREGWRLRAVCCAAPRERGPAEPAGPAQEGPLPPRAPACNRGGLREWRAAGAALPWALAAASLPPPPSAQVGDLKKGIAQFYDESSGLWEEVWGEHMHHGGRGSAPAALRMGALAVDHAVLVAKAAGTPPVLLAGCGHWSSIPTHLNPQPLRAGYYPAGGAPKSNQQAQIDMIEESLKWAGVDGERPPKTASGGRFPGRRLSGTGCTLLRGRGEMCRVCVCACVDAAGGQGGLGCKRRILLTGGARGKARAHAQPRNRPPLPHPPQMVDVGCGIGGSSRHIARKFGCTAKGITLSPVQAARANAISEKAGLGDQCSFQVRRQGGGVASVPLRRPLPLCCLGPPSSSLGPRLFSCLVAHVDSAPRRLLAVCCSLPCAPPSSERAAAPGPSTTRLGGRRAAAAISRRQL